MLEKINMAFDVILLEMSLIDEVWGYASVRCTKIRNWIGMIWQLNGWKYFQT